MAKKSKGKKKDGAKQNKHQVLNPKELRLKIIGTGDPIFGNLVVEMPVVHPTEPKALVKTQAIFFGLDKNIWRPDSEINNFPDGSTLIGTLGNELIFPPVTHNGHTYYYLDDDYVVLPFSFVAVKEDAEGEDQYEIVVNKAVKAIKTTKKQIQIKKLPD